MDENFFSYISSAISAFFSSNGAFLLDIGRNWYHATVAFVLFAMALGLVFRWVEPPQLFRAIALILVGELMITYYASPMPFVGNSLTGLVTNEAGFLSNHLESGMNEQIQTALNTAYLGMERPGWDNWASFAYYFLVVLAITALQLVMLAVTGFGLIATGVCVLLGPLAIAAFIFPGAMWIFSGWIRAFVQYSFYRVVASAMTFLIGNVLLQFFSAHPGPYSVAKIETMFIEILVILGTAIFSIAKVPSLTSSIFSGRSGESWIRG
jgi:hypothetical protein